MSDNGSSDPKRTPQDQFIPVRVALSRKENETVVAAGHEVMFIRKNADGQSRKHLLMALKSHFEKADANKNLDPANTDNNVFQTWPTNYKIESVRANWSSSTNGWDQSAPDQTLVTDVNLQPVLESLEKGPVSSCSLLVTFDKPRENPLQIAPV